MSEEQNGCKLYVGNLSYEVTNEQLKDHFKDSAKVISVEIKERNGKKLGYGYVEIEADDIDELITKMDQTTLLDRAIKVEVQQERSEQKRSSRGRRGRGKGRGRGGRDAAESSRVPSANYKGGKPVLIFYLEGY
eukprot:NODE_56_length_28873_cov_1.243101.p17 type:complete len:134 gc:universal NODE_56_length_28873_cov_1.243101:18609-18208(-)